MQQEYIHQSGLDQIELVKAVFDSKGDWLATVEQRQGSGSEFEMQLKLWAYNEQTQRLNMFEFMLDKGSHIPIVATLQSSNMP